MATMGCDRGTDIYKYISINIRIHKTYLPPVVEGPLGLSWPVVVEHIGERHKRRGPHTVHLQPATKSMARGQTKYFSIES